MPILDDREYELQQLYRKLPADVQAHCLRVSLYMQYIMNEICSTGSIHYADRATFDEEEQLALAREIGLYHDIGKIMVPQGLLRKRSHMTEDELHELQKHTIYSQTILMPFEKNLMPHQKKLLEKIKEVARSHHERWDGQGYPDQLKKEKIPFLARVCSVADTFDAITSFRCYSPPSSYVKAFEEIEACAGKQFDPDIVSAFLESERKEKWVESFQLA